MYPYKFMRDECDSRQSCDKCAACQQEICYCLTNVIYVDVHFIK